MSKKFHYATMRVFPKSAINGLTKQLSSLRFVTFKDESGQVITGNKVMINRAKELGLDVDYNDTDIPGERFTFTKPRKITREQTAFGKAWLKNHFFNLKGIPRRGKNTDGVSDDVLAIARQVTRFEFVGVLGVANQSWEIQSFLPIYRAFNSKGEHFDYAPIHWGQPVIMEG